MNTLNNIPILGKSTVEYAKIRQQKTLNNLILKRLHLFIRQQYPWRATLVMDLSNNSGSKNSDTLNDFSAYLDSKEVLNEIVITHRQAFAQLYAKWLSELGRQPDRLRVIYDRDQGFIEYDIKLVMQGKEKVIIQIQ